MEKPYSNVHRVTTMITTVHKKHRRITQRVPLSMTNLKYFNYYQRLPPMGRVIFFRQTPNAALSAHGAAALKGPTPAVPRLTIAGRDCLFRRVLAACFLLLLARS